MTHSHSRSWLHKNRRHGTRLTAFFLALVLVVAGSTNIGVTRSGRRPRGMPRAPCTARPSTSSRSRRIALGLRVGCARDSGQFRQLANNDEPRRGDPGLQILCSALSNFTSSCCRRSRSSIATRPKEGSP